jgi:two-component system cell cycle sensor histidine kinase/response regulator CckA
MQETPIRILLIEDDEDDYILIRRLLSQASSRFQLDWVSTFDAGLKAVSERRHDVYLLDYRLGDQNGLGLLRTAMGMGCSGPFIFLTGAGNYTLDMEAMRAGAADYLVKDQVTADLMERSIRYALDRKQARDALQSAHDALEARVKERTAELAAANVALRDEIEERKQAQEAIARAKQEWERTFDTVPDLIAIIDRHFRIVRVNMAMADRTGVRPEDAVGNPCHNLICLRGRTPSSCPHAMLMADGREHTVEIPDYRSEGAFIVSATPFHDGNGRLIGSVYVARDVSDYRRAEEERRKLEERLQHGQRMESIGTLAGGIAHDFNNLLAGIVGYISLAQLRTRSGDGIFELLSTAEETALRAKDLTQRLITFSKGGAPIKRTISVGKLIMNSAGLTLGGSAVRCYFSIPPDLWPVDVDEGQMGQVIDSLMQNAREAMPKGGVVTARAENVIPNGKGVGEGGSQENSHYVMISIEDEGCGIAPEDLRRVFDPYFSTKDMGAQKGMGLGLAIAHSIVTKHGGNIEAQSEVGKGSTFRVYLPASRTTPGKKAEGMVRRKRILVVDDEAIVRDVLGQMLKHLGYDVTCAGEGTEAVLLFKEAKASGNPFDVSLLDLSIPAGMGGKETIKKLKHITPDICAIVTTGYPTEAIMGDFRKYGFSAVLPKPCKVDELRRVLERVLSSREA